MGAMIDQISESSRSNADEAAMVAAIMAELEVEARCRFECARTITLMRAAKAKSMRLIIATDTCLNTALIDGAARQDVCGPIYQ